MRGTCLEKLGDDAAAQACFDAALCLAETLPSEVVGFTSYQLAGERLAALASQAGDALRARGARDRVAALQEGARS
jgi:hypothetical protein